jgi:transcriptional regulator with XRE-family HTH domain
MADWSHPPHSYLKAWRKFIGMNQGELAEKLGTTAATISRYETGDHEPPVSYIFMLADICGCKNPGDPISRLPDGWTENGQSQNTLRHIRKHVFRLTQTEFADLAGVAQSSVSRWEKGTPPALNELRAIRQAATKRGLNWDDSLFFEMEA